LALEFDHSVRAGAHGSLEAADHLKVAGSSRLNSLGHMLVQRNITFN
jgi:hypothetical protein